MTVITNNQPIMLYYKNPEEEERTNTWLWLWLNWKRYDFPPESFMAPDMRNRMMNVLCRDPRLAEEMQYDQGYFLLPKERLVWITGEERQIKWLLSHLYKRYGCEIHPVPPRLLGRNLVIANIDIWETNLDEKSNAVVDMERDWNNHKQSDQIFKWFKGSDEISRCELAWDWLKEKKGSRRFDGSLPPNYENLLIFFDHQPMSEAEKKLDVDAIKKRWSQQQYREKNTGKKQCNLLLSTQALADLNKLAVKYEVSKSQVLEALIRFEAKRGAYLPEKMRAENFE